MNRRGFLAALGLAAGAVAAPELLVPRRTFFLPPKGGWRAAETRTLGDVGPYKYTWSWISGGSGIVIDAPNRAVTTFTRVRPGKQSGLACCTITDSLGGRLSQTALIEVA